jgi:FtsH-binding integral membrane protein
LDPTRILVAGGLTLWLGGLVVAVAYTRRRMHFPQSVYPRLQSPPSWPAVVAGLLVFALTAYSVPTVAWVGTVFASCMVIYAMSVYVIVLRAERHRAARLGLPEPGTGGTTSFAESAVSLAISVLFAVAALALTVYGVANEIGGHRGEGGAALIFGAIALFITIVMGLFASPLLLLRLRRRSP